MRLRETYLTDGGVSEPCVIWPGTALIWCHANKNDPPEGGKSEIKKRKTKPWQNLNRYITMEVTQMDSIHMRHCTASFIVRSTSWSTIVYQLQWLKWKRQLHVFGKLWNNQSALKVWVGVSLGTTTPKTVQRYLLKLKVCMLYILEIPLLNISLQHKCVKMCTKR